MEGHHPDASAARNGKYDHLTIHEPIRWYETITPWRIENRFNHGLKRLLIKSLPNLVNGSKIFFRKGLGYLDSCEDILVKEQIHRISLQMVEGNIDHAQEFHSGYGYDDDAQEFGLTLMNYNQWRDGFPNILSESPAVFQETIKTASWLFYQDPSINSFLNFGVSYGNADALLACQHPRVKFVGIDRSRLTKTFNEIQLGQIDNLEFVAGDIFEYLFDHNFGGGVFFTSRTMMIFPKAFTEKLYGAVLAAGFRYIVGLEPIGISRQTGEPYVFSDDDQQSVVYLHKMFIHNYPGLLKKFGYTMIDTGLVRTTNGHRDFRIIRFVAKKV